jgi:hypothetical protein
VNSKCVFNDTGDELGTFGTIIEITFAFSFGCMMLTMLFFVEIMFPANNTISSIPSEIGRLTMLQELWLSKCMQNVFSMVPVMRLKL